MKNKPDLSTWNTVVTVKMGNEVFLLNAEILDLVLFLVENGKLNTTEDVCETFPEDVVAVINVSPPCPTGDGINWLKTRYGH